MPADNEEVVAIAGRLFRGASPAGLLVEREADLGAALRSRMQPDMAVSAGAADIGFVHRRTEAGDLFASAVLAAAVLAAVVLAAVVFAVGLIRRLSSGSTSRRESYPTAPL